MLFNNIKIEKIEKAQFVCNKCGRPSTSLRECSHCGFRKLTEKITESFKDILESKLRK